MTNEDLMLMIEDVARKAVVKSQEAEIERVIDFLRARLMSLFGEVITWTYANYCESDKEIAERMGGVADIIAELATCFVKLARWHWLDEYPIDQD